MPITPEDVADAVRRWCTAWHTRDIPTILAMEAQAGGFGFRRVDRRDHVAMGEAHYRKTLEQLFGRMEAYRLEPEEIQTAVTGEVGLAWGGVHRDVPGTGATTRTGPGPIFQGAHQGAPRLAGVVVPPRHPTLYGRRALPEDADGSIAHALRGH